MYASAINGDRETRERFMEAIEPPVEVFAFMSKAGQ